MKVLVAGGTGLIGRRLVRRLIEHGHEVSALTRELELADATLPVRCDFYEWNPARGNVDPEALEGVDAVINLAGESVGAARWTPERKREILNSRIDAARVLIGAIRELPEEDRPEAYLTSSAVGLYGDRPNEVLDELSAPGEGFLADVCRAWENEAARAEESGMRTVALRTGVVLSREGGALARMLPLFRLGLGSRLGNGKQWMSWIHVDDVVSLYVFALQRETLRGPINAVAPKPVTNAQFTKKLRRVLRRSGPPRIPASLLNAVLGDMAELLLGSQRVHPAEAQAEGFRFEYPDLGVALAEVCGDLSFDLEREIWLHCDPEEVFEFFCDARNLETITPPFLGMEVKRTSTPTVQDGTIIDYVMRLRGLPLRWRSLIESWHPPQTFTDVAVKSPYKSWCHVHEFEPFDDGTIIRDKVRYRLPGGALGALLAGGWVRKDLTSIFDYRRDRIFETFG